MDFYINDLPADRKAKFQQLPRREGHVYFYACEDGQEFGNYYELPLSEQDFLSWLDLVRTAFARYRASVNQDATPRIPEVTTREM